MSMRTGAELNQAIKPFQEEDRARSWRLLLITIALGSAVPAAAQRSDAPGLESALHEISADVSGRVAQQPGFAAASAQDSPWLDTRELSILFTADLMGRFRDVRCNRSADYTMGEFPEPAI